MKVKLPETVSRLLKPLAIVIGGALAPVAGHAADFDLVGGTFTPEKGDALERIVAQIDKEYGVKTTVKSLVDANTKTIKNKNIIRKGRAYNLPEHVATDMMVAKLAQVDAVRAPHREKTADVAKIENVQTVAADAADLPEGFSAAVLKAALTPSNTTIAQDRMLAALDAAADQEKQQPHPVTYPVLSFGDSVSGSVNGRTPSFNANDFVVLASNDKTMDADAVLKILSEEKPSGTPGMCVVQVEKPCTVTEEEKPAADDVVESQSNKKIVTVKKGDNLCGIAREENISFDGIVEEEGIKDPNVLLIGQKLDITDVGPLDKNGKLYKDFCTGTGPLPKPVDHAAAGGHTVAAPKTAPVAAGTPVSGFKAWGPIKPEQCRVEKTTSGKYVFKPLSQKWAECGCSSDSYWVTLYDANGNAYKKRVQGGSMSSHMCKDGGGGHVVTRPTPEPPPPPEPPEEPGHGGCQSGCGGGGSPNDDLDGPGEPTHEPPHGGGGEPPHEPPHHGGGGEPPHEPPHHGGGGEPPHEGDDGQETNEPSHHGGGKDNGSGHGGHHKGENHGEPSRGDDKGHGGGKGHNGEGRGGHEKHTSLQGSAPAPSFA